MRCPGCKRSATCRAFPNGRSEAGEPIACELQGRAQSPAVAPKQIACSANLPRTRGGKIMRRLLRARELGLPEGGLSTLEDASSAA